VRTEVRPLRRRWRRKGHSNREKRDGEEPSGAATGGIKSPTVRVLFTRAAKKLHAGDRREVLRRFEAFESGRRDIVLEPQLEMCEG